jgi:antitoxin (DNA-binding transcriptional repressor) of toxin-antitoxin stability system
MAHQNSAAQSIDVNQLGQAARIKRWLNAGETIELRDDHDHVVARIIPAHEDEAPPKKSAAENLQKRPARRKPKS